jgi:hypothetical protein
MSNDGMAVRPPNFPNLFCPRVRPVSASFRNRFSQTHAAPSERRGYRSSSANHRPPGNRPSDGAAFQHLHDAADDAAVVHPLDPADIRGQERLDPLPLFVAQPNNFLLTISNPSRQRITTLL